MDATRHRLVERGEELAALEGLLERAGNGRGALVVVEGSAGIGKTSLLDAAVELAAGAGATGVAAAGMELEQAFPWGVVRQLFEREVAGLEGKARERALAGVARLAEPIVAPSAGASLATTAAGEDPFAALHGLYWLCANLADERPVVVAVDDAQWADEPSLRFLAYLAARLAELPILLVVGTRPPDPDAALLRAVVRDSRALRLAPDRLTLRGVAGLLAGALGDEPDEAFARTCHEVTGGNPLLVSVLGTALVERRVAPSREHVDRARELGSRALSEVVAQRMLRLPARAVALARVVAVLAPDAPLRLATQLASLGEDDGRAAAGALLDAHILAPGEALTFVHPLVRSAIESRCRRPSASGCTSARPSRWRTRRPPPSAPRPTGWR